MGRPSIQVVNRVAVKVARGDGPVHMVEVEVANPELPQGVINAGFYEVWVMAVHTSASLKSSSNFAWVDPTGHSIACW